MFRRLVGDSNAAMVELLKPKRIDLFRCLPLARTAPLRRESAGTYEAQVFPLGPAQLVKFKQSRTIMRHQLPSESPQQGPATALPASITRPITRSIDVATLELLERWQREDAAEDPAQIQAAEEEVVEFMKAMNESRSSSGEPLLYP